MSKTNTPVKKASYAEYNAELSAKFSKRARIKRCFNNCINLIVCPDREFPADRAFYVEGVVYGIVPFHHAWLELDGEIIDPTRHKLQIGKLLMPDGAPLGGNRDYWTYEPKVRLTQYEACGKVADDQFPVWNFTEWWIEQTQPELVALIRAHQEAQAAMTSAEKPAKRRKTTAPRTRLAANGAA